MNKVELVKEISKKSKLSQKDASSAVEAMTEVITKALKKGTKVSIMGFGTWEVTKRSAREGRNPQTGKKITIKAKKVPKFRAGKTLKDAVN